MKILMIATEYPPAAGYGLARYASELASALVDIGHEVHVATCNYSNGTPGYHRDGVVVHNLRELMPVDHYEWTGNVVVNNLRLVERVLEISEEYGPFDVLVSHDWLGSGCAKAVESIQKIPWLLIMHDTEPGKRENKLDAHQKYISEMEKWSIDHADYVVTTSRFMAKELKKYYGIPKEKLSVVPCGVNPDRFAGDANIKDFRGLFAREDEKLLLYVGRLSPMKGVEDLFDAFEILLRDGEEIRLVVSGDGVLRPRLEKRAVDGGYVDRVTFTGFLGDKVLGAMYRAADLAVMPSRYEPFGLVALEAAACGARVVVGNVGGLAELAGRFPKSIVSAPPSGGAGLASRIRRELSGEDSGRSLEDVAALTWERAATELCSALEQFHPVTP